MKEIQIENKVLGIKYPTYFIADLAANYSKTQHINRLTQVIL